MKRSPALSPLSRDHHRALVVAHKLRRATEAQRDEARAAFLAFWWPMGARHVRAEEEVLLPAYARHGDPDREAVARMLADHVALHRGAADLDADPVVTLGRLHELGTCLHDHIRHEERVLFPLIEEVLPEGELGGLPAALDRAGGCG